MEFRNIQKRFQTQVFRDDCERFAMFCQVVKCHKINEQTDKVRS